MQTARFDLVIFDCDGVLVDSEPIANRVLCEQLNATGLRIDPADVMQRFVGRTKAGCLELATELLGRPLPEHFAEDWDTALFDALRREVKTIEGVTGVLDAIRLPYCVASNGMRARLRLTLESAGLLAYFDGRIFCAEDVAHPKPAPDLFLHAARTMGAQPDRCAVIEDTTTGAKAGAAAGMRVFGYAGGAHSSRDALEGEGAVVFGHMKELMPLLEAAR